MTSWRSCGKPTHVATGPARDHTFGLSLPVTHPATSGFVAIAD